MNQADVQYRFRVICDLNIQEYEEQRHLAETDPSWHRPSIELFRKLPPHQRINEDHIGSIATDAWAAATNAAATNLDMSDQDLQMFKQAAVSWPTEQKLHFLRAAAEHWMPPYQDETLWWQHNARSATEFLYHFPEIHQSLNNWPREPQEVHELQTELQTLQNNPQSPRRAGHQVPVIQVPAKTNHCACKTAAHTKTSGRPISRAAPWGRRGARPSCKNWGTRSQR